MAEQTYSIKFDAQTGPFVKNLDKAEKATAKLGKAQDALNKIALSSAAAQSPLQAIQVKSAQDLAKLNNLYKAGAITMQQYNTAVAQVIARQKAQVASMTAVSGGMRSMRGAMGQLGYQVQDVAVQLQMGQNAMLVFAQQGSQIASVFGPGGAVIGAVIALAGAIGMSLMPELKEAKKELGEISKEALEAAGSLELLTQVQREATIIEKEREIAEALKKEKRLRKELAEEEEKLLNKPKSGVMGFSVADVVPEESRKKVKAIKEEMTLLASQIDTLKKNTEELNRELETFKELNDEGAKAADLALKKELEAVERENQALMIRGSQLKKYYDYTEKLAQEDFDLKMQIKQDEWEAEAEHQEKIQKNLEKVMKDREKLIDNISGKMADHFLSMINGTKSVSESFKSMAKSIIDDLARMYIQATITKPLFEGLMGFSSSPAPVVDHSIHSPAQKAIGGSVSANTPYIVGEKGPELFIPNGAGSITKNSDLGSQGVTVVQNINVSTGVQQTVRTEIMGLMPQISEAAKGAVLEARLRGGSYASAFGG